MTNLQKDEFQVRAAKLRQRHEAVLTKSGIKHKDGKVIADLKPPKLLSAVPWRFLVVTAVLYLFAKIVVVSFMPQEDYDAALAKLKGGRVIERIGAALMTPDRVSTWLAGQALKMSEPSAVTPPEEAPAE
ncbi:MAG: hypothetical protein ACPGVK_11375 [Halocynthiibacter sp.]